MKRRPNIGFDLLVLLGTLVVGVAVQAQPVQPLLEKINAVGKEGKGNVEAAKALKALIAEGPEALLPILTALDDANPIAANYLRGACEAIADNAQATGKKLPAKKLEAFVLDTKQNGSARRLAYEMLVRIDPSTEDRLLPGMVDDPGVELRRDAVARLLKEAQKLFDAKEAQAKPAYEKALIHARDYDQVNLIVSRLKTYGVEINLTKHFGFITEWLIAGPFDSTDGVAYKTAYPPEKKVEPMATYTGKDGKKVNWIKHVTTEKLGLVDFNNVLGGLHDVAAYAYTLVHSPKEQVVEVRAGSNNAIQIFVNGQKIFGREEYHHGMYVDQHVGKAVLRKGPNQILVKVCQNNQTDTWAQQWSFQLRITDHLGTTVPVTVLLEKSTANKGE